MKINESIDTVALDISVRHDKLQKTYSINADMVGTENFKNCPHPPV